MQAIKHTHSSKARPKTAQIQSKLVGSSAGLGNAASMNDLQPPSPMFKQGWQEENFPPHNQSAPPPAFVNQVSFTPRVHPLASSSSSPSIVPSSSPSASASAAAGPSSSSVAIVESDTDSVTGGGRQAAYDATMDRIGLQSQSSSSLSVSLSPTSPRMHVERNIAATTSLHTHSQHHETGTSQLGFDEERKSDEPVKKSKKSTKSKKSKKLNSSASSAAVGVSAGSASNGSTSTKRSKRTLVHSASTASIQIQSPSPSHAISQSALDYTHGPEDRLDPNWWAANPADSMPLSTKQCRISGCHDRKLKGKAYRYCYYHEKPAYFSNRNARQKHLNQVAHTEKQMKEQRRAARRATAVN